MGTAACTNLHHGDERGRERSRAIDSSSEAKVQAPRRENRLQALPRLLPQTHPYRAPRRLWVCETLQADVNWRSRDLFSSKIVPRRPTISEQRAGLSVPVFDNLTAAQQDSTTARYRLGVDGARLESSKPFAQASTKVFSALRTESEVIKMIGPNFL